ncbi:acyltransferase [Bacillus sp. USDA818B3_A]|uniref:acyltransferase n=1 Tax=Bacillus sp. USDA818B3_A TaxID=2698834 RepID=UPI00136CC4B0|nr:acyltransferase [Bacillus sp. USDA818B3_A]
MKKTHLYEIDFMRTYIMLGVLSVHTMTIFTNQMDDESITSLAMSAVHSSMHVTRLAFMFITGLVLFITYYYREFHILSFWKKRLVLIAIPYLFWNVIYLLFRSSYSSELTGSFSSFMKELGTSLMQGDEFYIYFVLISFQFYLVFPFLLYGLRKFEKWHLQIFIGSVILQLVLMTFYKFGIPHLNRTGWPYLFSHYGVFVLTYQCWFISGGMVACHYEKICQFIERHSRAIIWTLLGSVAVMWAYYFYNRFVLLLTENKAQEPHQPLFLPYSLLVITVLFMLGRKWSHKRTEEKMHYFSSYIMLASHTSFGMFLVQPFPLFIIKQIVPFFDDVKWLYVILLPASILFVYGSSMFLSYWLNKIPLISFVVGKKSKLQTRVKTVPVPGKL